MTPESAKTEMLRANGVDSLLKLLQQFLNSKKIYYYVLGALTLLTGEGEQLDLEVCEVVRRRLGLTLIVDSVESFHDLASIFLDREVTEPVEQIAIENY